MENNLGKKKMFLTLQILATIYMLFVFPNKNMKTLKTIKINFLIFCTIITILWIDCILGLVVVLSALLIVSLLVLINSIFDNFIPWR